MQKSSDSARVFFSLGSPGLFGFFFCPSTCPTSLLTRHFFFFFWLMPIDSGSVMVTYKEAAVGMIYKVRRRGFGSGAGMAMGTGTGRDHGRW